MVCPQARLGWRSVVWGGLFLLLFGTVHLTAAPAKKVLLFHADNQFQPANLVMDSTFRSRLTGAPDLAVELYSEYLEAVRFPSPQTTALAVSLLKAKYRTVNLDLILVTDDTSWDFFSRVRQDLFPGIPVVFCGITEGKIGPKDLPPGTTGNFKNVDIGANLKAIQTLQPEVDRVLVVLGVSPQDQYYEKLARKAFAGVSHPAAVFLNGESIEEIGAATATPSPKTVALYISLYQDGMGKTFNPRDALDRLVAGSRIPVYGVSSTYLGHGIVGGNLLSFEDVSADASSMVLQILRGQDPGTIPPRTSENRSYFDWPQLVRWGIKGSLIPPGSVVLNRPPDPWVVYRWQILGTVAFLAFETALLVLLVSLLRIRSRTQRTLKIEIEERNAALLQLHESEQRYRLIFENSGTANAIVDLLGTVVLCNSIFADLLGQTRETLEGRSLNGRLDRYDGPLLQVIERTWKTGEFRAEAREMTLPGTQGPRWLESYWYALHLRSAGLDGVQVVIRDVTENKKLNEKLSQVQRLESIGVLAGGIAHDFNNLLSGLWGYLELARMNLVEGESLAAAGRLEKATRVFHRARGLTRQLLTFSKGGAPVLEVQNLGPLLSEWVGFAMSGATNSVELRVAPDLWSCLCDAQQISQVVDNLLINARQASGVGSPLVVEASNVEQSGRSLVRISVIDQGQGVPPELRQKIFEPFFSTKATGTGLGLATSTSIAVKHQGWLTVEPGPVRGSRFSLFLPAVSTPVRQELPGVVANFRGAGTALVVDDEEALRDSVGGFLTSMGFSVLLAANERQALDLCAGVWAQGQSVALGVLDLTTRDGPGGIEICRKLRQSGHPMVLIAMSGYSEELAGGSPGQAGFDGYLTKPFSLQELAQVLSGYFEGGGSRLGPGETPL